MPKCRHAIHICACLLCLAYLCGCAAPAQSTSPPAGNSIASSRQPDDSSASVPQPSSSVQPTGEGETIHIFLPAENTALHQLLQQLAAQDGNTLQVHTAPAGEGYAQQLQQAAEGQQPPALYWVENARQVPQAASAAPVNLSGGAAGPALQGLAGYVPQTMRLREEGAVYGLPLGYYAQGYLVDIELLAQLLGTQEEKRLCEDLTQCSFEEWTMLARTIEAFLAKPGRIQVTLNGNVYTTPSFRPAAAQPLRGVFAQPTGNAAAMCGSLLDAALAAGFDNAEEWQQAEATEKEGTLQQLFAALLGAMELETLHMAQTGGAVRRGEGYSRLDTLSEKEAQQLFGEGTALLLRADSRTAAKLQQEYPRLQDKLVMVPIKLPSKAMELPQAQLGENTDEETEEENVVALPDLSKTIEQNNRRLLVASDGYLCLAQNAAQDGAAQSLLLRLYTTREGQDGLCDIGLQPFSRPYPEGLLQNQVMAAAASQRQILPLFGSYTKAKEEIGAHLLANLMESYEWSVPQCGNFVAAAFRAVGETVPQNLLGLENESENAT